MTFRTPDPWPLEGGCNFRDLGGHETADGREVRRGVLYRSGVLTYLTPSDHNAIARARIRTIVDLRRDDEIATEPTRWATSVRNLSWQLDENIASSQRGAPWERSADSAEARAWMTRSYATMQDWLVEPLRGLFDAILAEDVPLLFHCAAGKDRTGFCAAMVLGLLGVSDETILAEYAYTNICVDLHDFTVSKRTAGMGLTDEAHPFARMDAGVRAALMDADPAYLQSALDSVRERHGSIEGYARSMLGLDAAQIDLIRQQLLED